MNKVIPVVGAALAVVAVAAAPASAGGPTVARMQAAGWDCFDPDGAAPAFGMHCAAPGGALSGNGAAQHILYFAPGTGEFLGTELLRFTTRDLSGLPCPGHPDGVWHNLGFAWACHHR